MLTPRVAPGSALLPGDSTTETYRNPLRASGSDPAPPPPSPLRTMNSSLTSTCAAAGCMPALPAATCATPWYFSSAPSLVRGVSDAALTLAAPVLAYWGLSLFFHALDEAGWAWPARFRIHDSAEVAQRNKATKADVLKAVVFQQLCQTALGVWWIEEHAQIPLAGHCTAAAAWAPPLARVLAPVLGAKAAQAAAGAGAYWVYWWAIPVLQFFWAMCVRLLPLRAHR
jgi:hypothetical protein